MRIAARIAAIVIPLTLAVVAVTGAAWIEASPSTVVATHSCGTPTQRVAEAQAALGLDPIYTVVAQGPDPRGQAWGWTDHSTRRTYLYVDPCSVESPAALAHVVAHEIGHAVDHERGTPAKRAAFLAAMDIKVWSVVETSANVAHLDYNEIGAETFAQCYSAQHGGGAVSLGRHGTTAACPSTNW